MPQKTKILIIDDGVDFAELAKGYLEDTGEFDVCLETQAKEGISQARRFQPDLILVDIVMPEIEGPEIVRQLKEDPELSKIKVAYFSSLISSREDASRRRLGNLPFVKKPSSSKELVESARLIRNG